MSSMTSSFYIHRVRASFANALHAPVTSPLDQYGTVIFTISSFLRKSKIPSDPITMNLSSGLMEYSKISGSAITPTDSATQSPMDRDIARPGMSAVCSQTLDGPRG